MTPIAVTLLTGFLGAGKTTLLRHILNEQHGYKIAVIENEFGEVSVDDQLIGDRATQIKTLTNGCICCTRSSELEDALLDLLDNLDKGTINFNRLVIECTGMADPGPIIQTFFSHEVICERYLLDGVIALVDAVHADEQMNQFTIAQSQVGYADRILLTKTDVAGESEKLRERWRASTPAPGVYRDAWRYRPLPAVRHQRFYAGRERGQRQTALPLYRGQAKRYLLDRRRTGLPSKHQRRVASDGKPAAGIRREAAALQRYAVD